MLQLWQTREAVCYNEGGKDGNQNNKKKKNPKNSRGHGLALDTKLFTDYLKPELTSKTLAT